MPNYIITGDCDDVLAKLKTTLKAQDARFDATLQSQFTLPAAKPRQVKPAPVPQQKAGTAPLPQQKAGTTPMLQQKPVRAHMAPAGKSAPSTGSTTGSMLSSNRNADDSVRGRLRTSLRSTPSR